MKIYLENSIKKYKIKFDLIWIKKQQKLQNLFKLEVSSFSNCYDYNIDDRITIFLLKKRNLNRSIHHIYLIFNEYEYNYVFALLTTNYKKGNTPRVKLEDR